MEWFKHDTNASSDAKIKKLILRHGTNGYAIYFHCLELIADSVNKSNINFELEHDSEIIADNLKVKGTSDKSPIYIVNEIMKYILELELFQEINHRIFCIKMIKRLDSSMTSNKNFRDLIVNAKKSHDTVMISHDTVMQEEKRREKNISENTIKEREVKKLKRTPSLEQVKEYFKEQNTKIDPIAFFNFYESSNWYRGKTPITKWKMCLNTWESRDNNKKQVVVEKIDYRKGWKE